MFLRTDLDKDNIPIAIGGDERSKPVVSDAEMFGPRGDTAGLKLAEGEGPNVVFMDADAKVGLVGDGHSEAATELVNEVNDWEKVLHGHAH